MLHCNPRSNVATAVSDAVDLGSSVYQSTSHDDKVGMSIEDRVFLDITDKEVYMNDSNSWVAPLPFKPNRPSLPNNKWQAAKRLESLWHTLERKPDMKEHFKFMQTMFDAEQAELAHPKKPQQECWCLPFTEKGPDMCCIRFKGSTWRYLPQWCVTEWTRLEQHTVRRPHPFSKEPVSVIADI